MTCEQAKSLLLNYLMEEATPAEQLEIRQHVEGCASCAEESARLKQTLSLVVRAEVSEEVPRRFRLVAEPVGWAAMFWRNSARLAFAGAGMACLAIGLLALSHTSISHSNSGWEIAFGSASLPSAALRAGTTGGSRPAVATVQATTASGALDRAEVVRLIAQAVAASEAQQQKASAQLVETVAQKADQRRGQDLRELSESFRYFQAAQTMMWKDQVQSQHVMGELARQVGFPPAQQ